MEILCDNCKPGLPPGRGNMYNPMDGPYHHPGQCREVDSPWVNYDTIERAADFDPDEDFDPYSLAGLTMLETVCEPEGHPFPEDTPGYKRLTPGYVAAIVVFMRGDVVEEVTPQHREDCAEDDMSWHQRRGDETVWEVAYRVRPATPEEAAGYLADKAEGKPRDWLKESV